tara:strand:+ start:1506 stop:2246 length:741 start_codon:yes stop_codon:yes gene_type:complete
MNKKTNFGYQQVNQHEKEAEVGNVFTSVAPNYDLMNDIMSFGMHRIWKRALIELSEVRSGATILDVASGTGDLPKLFHKQFDNISMHITDINNDMLAEGFKRSIDEGFYKGSYFALASGENLPYPDQSFDLITVGFGLRNFTNKDLGLKEMHRCLKPEGNLLILEFSKPNNSLFSKIYDWYSFNVIPKMGSIFANDHNSYNYLAESIRMHPDQENLKKMILDSNFAKCVFYNLLNGIVAIHKAKKQ